jgi:transcriptional regulator with XRE-family HTH domain
MLTPLRCRAARGLLHWTRERLAQESGLDAGSVTTFELEREPLDAAALAALTGALEAAGVRFAGTSDDDIVLHERREFG